MRRLATCAAVGALLLGSADGAWGQEMMGWRASRFDLGVYAGGSLTSNWYSSRTITLNGTDDPVQNDDEEGYSPGYAPAFGALASFWLTPGFGLRAHGAYIPMRPPTTEGPFEMAGERSMYVMNTWFYDLGLAVRPFAMRDVPRLLSSVYLFAGGGGMTVDLAGEDRAQCDPGILGLGGCLSNQPGQATVGQGTAGAGVELIPIGYNFAVFGELAVHAYDSPVHVGDAWVGPITAPTGSTVRIADDAHVVTGRLVVGLKFMPGVLIPPPPPAPPPPPPAVAPPPPVMLAPDSPIREIRVCLIENGTPREAAAQYNTATGDTTWVGGAPSTAAGGYAAGATWFINNEHMTVMGRRYVRYGLPRVLGVNEVRRTGDFQGIPVFAETGMTGTPEVLYVPVRPGCEFQPYQAEINVGAVRGE